MPTPIEIEIKGLQELQQKTEKMVSDLHGKPMLNAMRDSTLAVMRGARQNAPVKHGRLKASILPEIRYQTDEIIGVVGSNVVYAAYQEFGTGIYAMFPTAKSGKMKGGIKPRLYLTRAFEKAEAFIIRRFKQALKEVVD